MYTTILRLVAMPHPLRRAARTGPFGDREGGPASLWGAGAVARMPTSLDIGRREPMSSTRTFAACALSLAVAVSASAQAPQAPKPGPEHERLGYFVGKWTSEGEMKPSPFGPGGKTTGTDRCEWFEGKFAVICHSDGKGP